MTRGAEGRDLPSVTPTPSVPLWTHSSRVAGRDSLFFTSENNRCDQGLGAPMQSLQHP